MHWSSPGRGWERDTVFSFPSQIYDKMNGDRLESLIPRILGTKRKMEQGESPLRKSQLILSLKCEH